MASAFEPAVTIAQGNWLRLLKRGRWEYAQRTVGGAAAILIALTENHASVKKYLLI